MADDGKEGDHAEPSLAECRLTLVPKVGVYSINKDSNRVRGSITGIRVSAITCAPMPDDGEDDLGLWSASEASVTAMVGSRDRGPVSGIDQEYREKQLIRARQRLLLTPNRLLGAAEGRTAWGDSGQGKVGTIVVWQWDFEHIHEISTYRIKKYMKMWDAGLTILCRDPQAKFEFSGLGSEAHAFSSRDDKAKAARIEKSEVLGFANQLATVAAKATGRQVTHSNDGDKREPVDIFRLA